VLDLRRGAVVDETRREASDRTDPDQRAAERADAGA
jgi:hypothetical protein